MAVNDNPERVVPIEKKEFTESRVEKYRISIRNLKKMNMPALELDKEMTILLYFAFVCIIYQ